MSFFSSVRGNLGSTGRGVRRRNPPTWVTATGSLGTTFDSQRGTKSYTVSATSEETITYSVTSGSLPTGMSLTSANGFIGGTASAVGSNTTSTFDITATSSGGTAVRSFSIEVKAPQITSFTATGASTFSVPTGVTAVRVLVIAGGGSGGDGGGGAQGGGGGAGGYIEHPSLPVTPGGSVPLTVGAGGAAFGPAAGTGNNGSNSTFGPLTAIGGGAGGGNGQNANPGGSGGGADRDRDPGINGTGTQPAQPGDSGTFGFGNPGGYQPGPAGAWGAGGGGGANGAGTGGLDDSPGAYPAPTVTGGNGGNGRVSDITGSNVTRAGGGGGSSWYSTPGRGGPGGGGNGGGGPTGQTGPGGAGTPNTGSGGGGNYGPGGPGGAGGPGIVIVRF